jgi:hypothetical protein
MAHTLQYGYSAYATVWRSALRTHSTHDVPSDLEGSYQRLDLALYAPLCLALTAGTALVVRRGGSAPVIRAEGVGT